MELKEGIKYSDLVLDVPLGLLALHAEFASEVNLVAGSHLDCPEEYHHCHFPMSWLHWKFVSHSLIDNYWTIAHPKSNCVFMIKTHLSTGSSIHSTFSWKKHILSNVIGIGTGSNPRKGKRPFTIRCFHASTYKPSFSLTIWTLHHLVLESGLCLKPK